MPGYITTEELDRAGMGDALGQFTTEDKASAIEMATSEADAYLGKVVGVPLDPLRVPAVVKLMIARMATYYVFSAHGFSLTGDDAIVRDNYDLALRFFQAIAGGKATLGAGFEPPSDPTQMLDGPYFSSDEDRGFGGRRV